MRLGLGLITKNYDVKTAFTAVFLCRKSSKIPPFIRDVSREIAKNGLSEGRYFCPLILVNWTSEMMCEIIDPEPF